MYLIIYVLVRVGVDVALFLNGRLIGILAAMLIWCQVHIYSIDSIEFIQNNWGNKLYGLDQALKNLDLLLSFWDSGDFEAFYWAQTLEELNKMRVSIFTRVAISDKNLKLTILDLLNSEFICP